MSEKINLTKEAEGEYKVPDEVWNANWRDDIPEEKEAEDETIKFEAYKNEKEYISPKEISKEAENLILTRAKAQKIGHRIKFLALR